MHCHRNLVIRKNTEDAANEAQARLIHCKRVFTRTTRVMPADTRRLLGGLEEASMHGEAVIGRFAGRGLGQKSDGCGRGVRLPFLAA
jgi:hypothetical protein